MVLLVPDDMPAGASTLEGNVEEMRALYKEWDPRQVGLISFKEKLQADENPEYRSFWVCASLCTSGVFASDLEWRIGVILRALSLCLVMQSTQLCRILLLGKSTSHKFIQNEIPEKKRAECIRGLACR